VSEPPASAVLEAREIVKRFGKHTALDGVDFSLREGEVHALVGENGAGKSTLMNVLYGSYAPDGGTITLRGRQVRFTRCADALRAGIGMVFQHFLLVERFSAAENVLLGREPSRMGWLDSNAANDAVLEIARRYGFSVEPAAPVEHLGVGARQQVELLKVLERDARIVILDEPTASLSPVEAQSLFDVVRRLRGEGRAIALVSHKLREVLDVADRITVLRAGKVVGSVQAADADASMLATMMVGRSVDLDARVPRSTAPGPPALSVRDLEVRRDNGALALRDVTVAVRSGEIVGVAGVEGNGQLEFAESLYGLRTAIKGTITLLDRDVTKEPATVRRALGMRYVPADRLREGLVLEFNAAENVLLGDQHRAGGFFLDLPGARSRAAAIADEYALAGFDPDAPVATYSGGMQQKLIAGRELASGAVAVIAYTPTRGVDIGAAETIHGRLRRIRDEGAAVVLVSYDLDEIRALSDRIIVFTGGAIAGELDPSEATDDSLGRLMGGVTVHA
jgi:ABC-type uncharacterized transport system ATPase subunit